MKTMKLDVNVDAEMIGAVVDGALDAEMLCGKCTALFESRSDSQQQVRQAEICSSCQAVINQLLQAEIEQRVHRVMKERGIPLDALQIGKKH